MEQKSVKLSILQMNSVLGNIGANIKKVEDIIKRDLQEKTDVIILPEVWTVGWACDRFVESAQDISSSRVINFLSNLAKEYHSNIIGGSFIVKDNDRFYNTCPVIDRNGNLVCTYSKMHLYLHLLMLMVDK